MSNTSANRLTRWIGVLLIVLVIAGLLAWRLPGLDAFSLSNDEGAYLMWAWLVHSGHPLYSQTVSVSAPLFIALLNLAFDVAGVSLVTGRAVALSSTLLVLLVLAWLSVQMERSGTRPAGESKTAVLAGLVTVLAIGISPRVFLLSRMAMGEMPSLAIAILSVALAFLYWRSGRWPWLVLSGIAFSLSLLAKVMNPLLILPIGWFILDRNRVSMPRRWYLPVTAWIVAGLLPVLACILAYDPAAMFDQAVAFRFELRETFPWQPVENITWLRYFAVRQWGIVALAGVGLVLLVLEKQWHNLVPTGLWLLGSLLTILTHSPLFPHHTVILLPPLALLAGLGAAATWRLLGAKRWMWSCLGLAGGLAFLVAIPSTICINQQSLQARFGRETDAITFLAQVTRPEDNVIADNLLLAFMAGRQTPPPLGDLAQVAIDSGRQTSQRLIAISEVYPVEAVASWALRLPYLGEYVDWVEDNYLVRKVWDDHHVLYFGREVARRDIPIPHTAKFEDSVELLGYDVQLPGGEPGSLMQVTLFWTGSDVPEHDYTVFVHLYDGNSQLVVSHDGPPLFGYLPTSQWSSGRVIPDRHDFALPETLPPGDYRLAIGLYDPATGRRLPVLDEKGIVIGDHVELEQRAIP